MASDDQPKQPLNVRRARKCSPLFPLKHRLTQRHVQMLATLAQQRALTRDQLTALFFGSKRRCQAALALLKRLGLIRHVIYLPQPLAGSGPRAYILTAEGARIAAQVTGINRKVLGLRVARTGRSFLHINHTLAINDFYVQLLSTTKAAGGQLGWLSQDEAPTAYTKNGKPTLTPDGAAEVTVGERTVRAYIEIDRGTEQRHWLKAKVRRYLKHQGGRHGADELYILFIVPGPGREAAVQAASAAALRWAYRPAPQVWTTTNAFVTANGPLELFGLGCPEAASGYHS
jgi:protein involved in plasmid replication-relaxation